MIEWIAIKGHIKYKEALSMMEERVKDVIDHKKPEAVFLLEHEDTYTAGTGYKKEELLNNNDIPIIYTGRGGKFTYHGPGQLVIYPILDLRKNSEKQDIKLYVKTLEQWIINSLSKINIKAYRIENMVGIWIKKNNNHAKIAALGIRVKKWVTYHGIAINISTNLEKYSGIIPCGINNFPVTSLHDINVKISIKDFSLILEDEFKKLFLQ